ncbi:MAG: T9SS type A sorting domain-containing protein [Cytophagales bacterium]|nr:T9SS type A sorting domain-containing protein [Cytophagales bacterium]
MMNLLIRLILVIAVVFVTQISSGQDCTTSSTTYDFFSGCTGQTAVPGTGDYSVKVKNNQTLVINGDLTINGILTINLVGSTSEVLVESPYTLTATNLTFTGSATGKVLIIEGPSATLDVSGTLDFGGNTIEIEGEGTIAAGTITGGGSVICEGTGTCPTFDPSPTCAGGGICIEAAVVPVELISFEAKLNEAVSFVGCLLQSLTMTISQLKGLLMVSPITSSARLKVLEQLMRSDHTLNNDESALAGVSYYRLKQTDYDGRFEYFNTKSVSFNGAVTNNITVYPNPVVDVMGVQNFTDKTKDLRLLNIHGKDVTGRVSIKTINSGLILDLCQLESGIYFLKTALGTNKIIKQ